MTDVIAPRVGPAGQFLPRVVEMQRDQGDFDRAHQCGGQIEREQRGDPTLWWHSSQGPPVMAEHDGGVRPQLHCQAATGVLFLLYGKINQITGVQQWPPAREQIVEANTDSDASIHTWHCHCLFNDFAAV